MNKICVYAICKNESQFVEKWVNSMSEDDCIVVLDTGSTDDTVEKLRKLGVKVEQKIINPWRFDVARNESLKLVPDDCNILVCTDLDEVFEPGWAKVLRDNWDSKKHNICWYKYVWSHNSDGSEGTVFWYNKIHARGFKWCAPVHEGIAAMKEYEELFSGMDGLVINDGIKLHHYPVQKEGRNNYLPLLEIRKQENPDDPCSFIYLGREYFFYERYKDAINCLEEMISYKDKYDISPILLAYACILIGKSYMGLGDVENAKKTYKRCIEFDKTYRGGYYELGKIYWEQDNDANAAYYIMKEGLEKAPRQYSWLEDEEPFSYHFYDILSLASYYSGHKKDSLLYAFMAREMNKSEERLNGNVELILHVIEDKELA